MAKVKIYLEPGETQREAEEALHKAFITHANGEIHKDNFQDPAMADAANLMENMFKKINTEMLEEINEALAEDYKTSYGN